MIFYYDYYIRTIGRTYPVKCKFISCVILKLRGKRYMCYYTICICHLPMGRNQKKYIIITNLPFYHCLSI